MGRLSNYLFCTNTAPATIKALRKKLHNETLRRTIETVAKRFSPPAPKRQLLSKTDGPGQKYWRISIKLNRRDRAMLLCHPSTKVQTRSVVRRSGVLDLLPKELDDRWAHFGTAMEHNVIGNWDARKKPITAKGGHKLWVMEGR